MFNICHIDSYWLLLSARNSVLSDWSSRHSPVPASTDSPLMISTNMPSLSFPDACPDQLLSGSNGSVRINLLNPQQPWVSWSHDLDDAGVSPWKPPNGKQVVFPSPPGPLLRPLVISVPLRFGAPRTWRPPGFDPRKKCPYRGRGRHHLAPWEASPAYHEFLGGGFRGRGFPCSAHTLTLGVLNGLVSLGVC